MRGAIAFLISSTPVIFEDSFPLTTLSIHLASVSSDCLFSLNSSIIFRITGIIRFTGTRAV